MSRFYKGLACFFLLFSGVGHAGGFCLLAAENYYEQLYCEVKAQGQGKRLPSFYDFKKNNEQTQAFLLMRPAAKLGIQVVKPKSVQSKPVQPTLSDQKSGEVSHIIENSAANPLALAPSGSTAGPFDGCLLQVRKIQCDGVSYGLVGNLSNKRLSKGVLDGKNKMNIPGYQGKSDDRQALAGYLAKAYDQYILKMLEIGLGGSTFTYNKFVYLYYDVSEKGIDFSQRFETMFGYLKQDKKNLAVSEKLPETVYLKKERCDWLRKKTVVCDGGQKNYVFQRY